MSTTYDFESESGTVSGPVDDLAGAPSSDADEYLPQESLEVHRDGPLSLVVGAFAGVVAVAFLLRGVGTGSLLDWTLFALTGAVAVMHVAALVDARAPLLVLDTLGVRLRRGSVWEGVAWSDVDHLEHRPRVSTLRDGSLTVVTSDGRRLGTRLSLSTRLVGADWHEVEDALEELSGGSVPLTAPPRPERRVSEPLVDVSEEPAAAEDVNEVVDEDVETVVEEVVEQDVEQDRAAEPEDELEVVIAPQRASRPALRGEAVLTPSPEPVPEHVEPVTPAASEALAPQEQTQTIVIDGLRDAGPVAPRVPVEPVVACRR